MSEAPPRLSPPSLHRADVVAPGALRRGALAPSRPRRLPTPRGIARRRMLVRAGKFALPLLAAAILAVMVFWPEIEGRDARISFRRGPGYTPEALHVVAPRYQGVDEAQRLYTLTARQGRMALDKGPEEVVLLEDPQADLQLSDGGWVYIESARGRYDRPARLLDLEGEVTVFHDNGVMFRTDQAEVRLDEGKASGTRPTEAQGPFGTIRAEGFEITERGAVVVFTGRAHAVLEGGGR